MPIVDEAGNSQHDDSDDYTYVSEVFFREIEEEYQEDRDGDDPGGVGDARPFQSVTFGKIEESYSSKEWQT